MLSDPIDFPKYDRPPIVETVLGVQFDRLANARNAHLGVFWELLRRDGWTTVTDAPPLPNQFEHFENNTRWAKASQIQLTQDPSCRLRIRNSDEDRMLQVQSTRLHLNWLKREGAEYPSYEAIREEFFRILRRFVEFAAAENLGQVRPNQWEVTYVNQIPRGTVWNSPSDWSFFQPLNPVPSVKDVFQAESFRGDWRFVLRNKLGRLHIDWQHGSSQAGNEENVQFIRLTSTARGPVPSNQDGEDAIFDGLNEGRRAIVCAFKSLMSMEANKYWGLKT